MLRFGSRPEQIVTYDSADEERTSQSVLNSSTKLMGL